MEQNQIADNVTDQPTPNIADDNSDGGFLADVLEEIAEEDHEQASDEN